MSVKLLSVDDSKTIRMIVTRALKNYDCIVCQAANGEEGLALAISERPDVIVLDITMPVMDGVTMLGRLREDANQPQEHPRRDAHHRIQPGEHPAYRQPRDAGLHRQALQGRAAHRKTSRIIPLAAKLPA